MENLFNNSTERLRVAMSALDMANAVEANRGIGYEGSYVATYDVPHMGASRKDFLAWVTQGAMEEYNDFDDLNRCCETMELSLLLLCQATDETATHEWYQLDMPVVTTVEFVEG